MTDPANHAAERVVLGAMMLAPHIIDDVIDILVSGDFHDPRHGEVFAAITATWAANRPVEPVGLAAFLAETGSLGRVGGGGYLYELLAACPTAPNATWYAREVAATARRRRLSVAGSRIHQMAESPERDVDEVATAAHSELAAATEVRTAADGIDWSDLAHDGVCRIRDAGEGVVEPALSTGLPDLDRPLAGGLRPGQLVVVAGRPGMGKSMLALNIAQDVVAAGEPVVFFSLEMSRAELADRMYSSGTGLDLAAVRAGIDMEQHAAWQRINSYKAKTAGMPLYVSDTPSMDLAHIRSTARRQARRYGHLGLIVVDYLQLMRASRRFENRTQEVSEMARGLKELAREMNCTVLAAAQLNRGPETRADKRPMLADMRESGEVENAADVVILLHRAGYYDADLPSPACNEAEFMLAKNRNGPRLTVTVAAQMWCVRFRSYERESL